jgi:hypothetical protein
MKGNYTKEKVKEYNRKYWEINRDKLLAKQKLRYREKHPFTKRKSFLDYIKYLLREDKKINE